MHKLFALTKIILPRDDTHPEERFIPLHGVFDATSTQKEQFEALGSARPATREEIEVAKKAQAIADGTAFVAPPAAETPAAEEDPFRSAPMAIPRLRQRASPSDALVARYKAQSSARPS